MTREQAIELLDRHTAALGLKVRDVQAGLGIVNQRFQAFEEAAQALTKVQLDGVANGDEVANSYIPALEQIIKSTLTELSTDPLISGADQTVFTQQLALAAGDSQ